MQSVNVYFNFPGNTEQAFGYYRSVFGGELHGPIRFREFGGEAMGVSADELDKIAHVALPIGNGVMLMGTDVVECQGRSLVAGNNVHLSLEAESEDEANRLFDALSEGGEVAMPLSKTEWAEKYGCCKDRFGIQWMVNFTGNVTFGA